MSRHKLQPRPDRPDIDHAIVGWDRPLETFFAQVFTTASPDEDPIVWVGGDYREIATPEAAIDAVLDFAMVPATIRGQLLQDYADGPSRPAGRVLGMKALAVSSRRESRRVETGQGTLRGPRPQDL